MTDQVRQAIDDSGLPALRIEDGFERLNVTKTAAAEYVEEQKYYGNIILATKVCADLERFAAA